MKALDELKTWSDVEAMCALLNVRARKGITSVDVGYRTVFFLGTDNHGFMRECRQAVVAELKRREEELRIIPAR